jgi:tetratricopeptide (TPR) repeat protein
MGKDPLTKIKEKVLKAEKLFKARGYKKASKLYHKAATNYLELKDYRLAKDCFLKASECYLEMEKYSEVLEVLKLAGDVYLMIEKYSKANHLYKSALNIIPKLRSSNEKNFNYILFPVLSYLCSFVEIKQESGLNFIKKYQGKVDNEYFKQNELVKLVTDVTIANRDKNVNMLEKVVENIENFKFTQIETELLKKVLMLSQLAIGIKSELNLDKELYTTNDLIHLKLDLNAGILSKISNNSFFEYKVDQLKITKLNMKVSDNLALSNKPSLPYEIPIDHHNLSLEFTLKPHFQLDEPYIGPVIITLEVNGKISCEYMTDIIKPKLISPPASLKISIKNLRPPLIGQSFPLEILLENESDGEALDVKVLAKFPEQLKIIRGTIEKQIYSLRSNEKMKWELNIKPEEVGDFKINFDITFKDSDQNPIEINQEFPFSITM